MSASKLPPSSSSSKTLKQGNLFSFFSKKQPTGRQASPSTRDAWRHVTAGSRIAVYWPDDDEFYDATVSQHKMGSSFVLKYDDGEIETIDLRTEKFKILRREQIGSPEKASSSKRKEPTSSQEQHDSDEKTAPKKHLKPPDESCKRRRIIESENEMEFDEQPEESDNESEGSAYVDTGKADEDDEDEAVSWLDNDEDDEVAKRRKPQKLRVTMVNANTEIATKKPMDTSKTSRSPTPSNVPTPVTISPKNNGFARFASSESSSKMSPPSRKVTPSPSQQLFTPPSSSKTMSVTQSKTSKLSQEPSTTTLPYTMNAVNPAGSHVHNHLKFLQQPRDANNREPSHPDYDPRTLKVNLRELERHSKVTPASQQWWDLKAQYFDTVLLFKTGKFYEMFHMDADVGVNVLNFAYMKGHIAHAGFPEIGYGSFCNKLVQHGYKVARVEQTETPEMLKERKKKAKGKKPQVVNREVCSVMSAGTRTFCYMDDVKCLNETNSRSSNAIGPLLAIKEVLVPPDVKQTEGSHDLGETQMRSACEYGVTIVDAVRGTITIGQFADDILRSRMDTLLTTFAPSEVLIEGGSQGASPALVSLLNATISSRQKSGGIMRLECIHPAENFPSSTAVDPAIRKQMDRKNPAHPWKVQETLQEFHRRSYYPRASKSDASNNMSRWPIVLKAAIEGNAELMLSSFGAALFYMQRSLIDGELLTMGIVKAYIPPTCINEHTSTLREKTASTVMTHMAKQEMRKEDGIDVVGLNNEKNTIDFGPSCTIVDEKEINHMALDGTTLHNLEILTNQQTCTEAGSLWSKLNHTKTPHGSRLLRAWLLRPLFRKDDIERRADAVEELASGAAAVAIGGARAIMSKCGDLERLLSRVHSMGGSGSNTSTSKSSQHPNERAVLYETKSHTKRKVEDFSKVLGGLRQATQIPSLFENTELRSGMLNRIVRTSERDGCFPKMEEELDWFFENFDCQAAAQGLFEPSRGMDEAYDEACDTVERIEQELNHYKDEMCSHALKPSHTARSQWKYINTKVDSKDKYLIELPVSIKVPDDFFVKGKRGSGAKQINKYRTPRVEQLVEELEHALDIQKAAKERGMQIVFSKFDSMRPLWDAAAQATAMLDALGALAHVAAGAGYTRPRILDCPIDGKPGIHVVQGRHPCVDVTHCGGDFIPNDLGLGTTEETESDSSRVLLLSGPNMGGKSTLLRQTCLIAILAQIGCFVPAEECALTPIDRIFTRLGASDRILLGQSTFFVELAETATALRSATRRSLVIMDELGRGTSTFDGTAIASATVKHLVEQNKCLALFATHYHSLLDEWRIEPNVRLGHMQCIVDVDEDTPEETEHNITFLYTLGRGACPRSFGINVARLAALPSEVLTKAKEVSSRFEAELSGQKDSPVALQKRIQEAVRGNDWDEVERLWVQLQ